MSKKTIITLCCILTIILTLSANVISSQSIRSSMWLKSFHEFYGLQEEVNIHQDLDENFKITKKALISNRDLIQKLQSDIESLEQVQRPIDFPVGTVIASILPFEKFRKEAGAFWKPADGRKISTKSRYAKLTGKKTLPDLRSIFLRGLNQFDPLVGPRLDNYKDPEGEGRKAGSFQSDATCLPNKAFAANAGSAGAHTHVYSKAISKGVKSGSHDGASAGMSIAASAGGHAHEVKIDGGGDIETRPKNIAVYYYIKIN